LAASEPPPVVMLLQPYHSGSHAAWAASYRAHSRLKVDVLAMPGRFWKWRMHGAAVTLARRAMAHEPRPDVVLATDMLDLASFLGLARRRLAGVPAVLYMHENQLAYPGLRPEPYWTASRRRRAARRDARYPFVNLTSALAADVVAWSSRFNRNSFLERLPAFLRQFPDCREPDAVGEVAARSRILAVGLDLASLDRRRPSERRPGPPRVLWNHRWEHDKCPELFFGALEQLAARGVAFEVAVLGESFGRTPPVFALARERLAGRVIRFGYAEDRDEYARWLWDADVVVSTARHEFFGAAVCEALYCGCRPLLPRDLAYPEMVPERWHAAVLYDRPEDLPDRLQMALAGDDAEMRAALRHHVARFDWRAQAPVYDDLLSGLASAAGPAP